MWSRWKWLIQMASRLGQSRCFLRHAVRSVGADVEQHRSLAVSSQCDGDARSGCGTDVPEPRIVSFMSDILS